ncbi:MAG: nucleotide exchange factor GrpE [Dehalococcoidia bacterium]
MTPEKKAEHNEPDDEARPDALDQDPDALRQALEEETGKAEGYLANWTRAQADLENFKKKVDQEKADLETFANAMLVSSLLSTLDDLERAFASLDASLAGLTWIDGLKLVYRKLISTLEGQGLAAISTEGQSFDPKHHEAVMQVPGAEGKVIGELQKGYTFRDRVIRPALVKVGNGETAVESEAGFGEGAESS